MPIPDLKQFMSVDPEQQGAIPDLRQFMSAPPEEGFAADTPVAPEGIPDLTQFSEVPMPAMPEEGFPSDIGIPAGPTGVMTPIGRGGEFRAGLSSATDNLQMTLFGVAQGLGRALDVDTLEDFGVEGVERNALEAQEFAPTMPNLTDVDSFDDFFDWAAGGVGTLIPSIATVIGTGGLTGILAKKAITSKIRKNFLEKWEKELVQKGLTQAGARAAARDIMGHQAGRNLLRDSLLKGGRKAAMGGSAAGVFVAGSAPQIGEAEIGLSEAGTPDFGTAVVAGLTGGFLESLPALRVLSRMFPGVDTAVSKGFVRDFAEFIGKQTVLEGGTEGAQELIQQAALAYHDPSFDFLDPDNTKQIANAAALGALGGLLTGGLAETPGGIRELSSRVADRARKRAKDLKLKPNLDAFKMEFDEGITDPDFEPADNTLFQEVRGRVQNVVNAHITPAMNTVRDSVQGATDRVSATIPGLAGPLKGLTASARAAHEEFVAGHQHIVDDAKRWAAEQIQFITETAEGLTGQARTQYIDEQMQKVAAEIGEVAGVLRERGERLTGNLASAVEQAGMFDEDATAVDPLEVETEFTFGQKNTQGAQTVGWQDKASAQNFLKTLRRRFPSSNDSTFSVRKDEDGKWIVALAEDGQAQTLRDDIKTQEALTKSAASARRNPNRTKKRTIVKVQRKDPTGRRRGHTGPTQMDVRTLAIEGKHLDQGDNRTVIQGFAAVVGRMLDRGIIDNEGARALQEGFDKEFSDPNVDIAIAELETLNSAEARALQEREAALERTRTFLEPRQDIEDEITGAEGEPTPQDEADLLKRQAETTRALGPTASAPAPPSPPTPPLSKFGKAAYDRLIRVLNNFPKPSKRTAEDKAEFTELVAALRIIERNEPALRQRRERNLQQRRDRRGPRVDKNVTKLVDMRDTLVKARRDLSGRSNLTQVEKNKLKGLDLQIKRVDQRLAEAKGTTGSRAEVSVPGRGPNDIRRDVIATLEARKDPLTVEEKRNLAQIKKDLAEAEAVRAPKRKADETPTQFKQRLAIWFHPRTPKSLKLSEVVTTEDQLAAAKKKKDKAEIARLEKQLAQEERDFGRHADPDDAGIKGVQLPDRAQVDTLALNLKKAREKLVKDLEARPSLTPAEQRLLGDLKDALAERAPRKKAPQKPKRKDKAARIKQKKSEAAAKKKLEEKKQKLTQRSTSQAGESRSGRTTPGKAKPSAIEKELARLMSRKRVEVMMPDFDSKTEKLVQSIVEFVTKMLAAGTNIRVIDFATARQMVNTNHPHAEVARQLLDTKGSPAAVLYQNHPAVRVWADKANIDNLPTYVILDAETLANAGAAIGALIHELGHVIHFDTWSQLSVNDQDALWDAFVEDVKSGKRATGRTISSGKGSTRLEVTEADISVFEFREWMADNFVTWMNNRRAPRNAVERFFEEVGKKIDQLWDFMTKNPGRFSELNEAGQDSYNDFIQQVADGVRIADVTGVNHFYQNENAKGRGLVSLIAGEATSLPAFSNPDTVPRGLTRQQWDSFVNAVDKKYPEIVSRAKVFGEWMQNAYYGIVAPSTSVMRTLSDEGIKAADQLVVFFNRREHGKARKGQNYHQSVKWYQRAFASRFEDIMSTTDSKGKKVPLSDAKKAQMVTRMRNRERGDTIGPPTLREQQLRRLFDDMHAYAREAGLPIGRIKDYFPRMMSRELLINNQEKILKWLMTKTKNKGALTRAKAEAFFNSLISEEADAAAAQRELQKDELSMQSPSFKNMRSRTAADPFWDQFLETNLDATVFNYINSLVKRSEFNKRFGEKAEIGDIGGDALPKSQWNPQANLEGIMSNAKAQGATDEQLRLMKNYIDANLGRLGRDFFENFAKAFEAKNPKSAGTAIRTGIAAIIAYQNMRVLMFTVFASLPDIVGPAIRTGNLRRTFKVMLEALSSKEVLQDGTRNQDMARYFGVVSSTVNQSIMAEYVDNHYMPPTLRKWNDGFFKWTGLNWFTDTTRRIALAVGEDFIQHQAERVDDMSLTPKQRAVAKSLLAELGLTQKQVRDWIRDGKNTWGKLGYDSESEADKRVATALLQFVDESIMSPNPSQRPLLASHPAMALVFHLKGFLYAFHDTILKRMAFNIRRAGGDPFLSSGENYAQLAAAVSPAIMIMALTALGLELREEVTRDKRTNRMDGWDYTWTVVERSGLLGITQLGFDFESASARGQSELAGLSGPAIGQVGDLLSKPISQTIPKAIPGVSQLPWARNALRDFTPL